MTGIIEISVRATCNECGKKAYATHYMAGDTIEWSLYDLVPSGWYVASDSTALCPEHAPVLSREK